MQLKADPQKINCRVRQIQTHILCFLKPDKNNSFAKLFLANDLQIFLQEKVDILLEIMFCVLTGFTYLVVMMQMILRMSPNFIMSKDKRKNYIFSKKKNRCKFILFVKSIKKQSYTDHFYNFYYLY